ncbi:MAG: hypothetical protein AB1696_07945 [Planctomycetota bacterium]
MKTQVKSLSEITAEAMRVLCKEMGVVNTIRFINQFTTGYGNYTDDRKHLFRGLTLKQIIGEVKQMRKKKALRT